MSIILISCAVVLTLMCATYIFLESKTYREAVLRNVSTLAAVIASNSSAALAFDNTGDAQEVLNALQAEVNIQNAALYKIDNSVFVTYPAGTGKSAFPEVQPRKKYLFNGNYLHVFQPVMQGEEQLGTLYLKSDLKAMFRQIKGFGLIGLALMAGSLIIAYFLSILLQRMISEPIVELEKTAKIISEKRDYSVRAVKSGNDEVGALTDAFNQMLGEIQLQNSEILSFNQKLEQKVEERTAELQHQKEFVETIINASVDLVAVFDKEMKYIMINKRTHEYYATKDVDLIGKNLIEVFPQVEKSKMYEGLKNALNGVASHDPKYKSEVLNCTLANYYIPLRNINNEVYGVLTIGHDITNLVEANEKLEKVNAELMKSNRDLEQFAYVASHDLQEPLRKIQTFTQMLHETEDKEQIAKYYEKINQSSTRMKDLIRDMLNFSRISNSEDAFVETDLNRILQNLIIDFELLLREKNAVIHFPNLPTVPGVPLQLSQLFANIINNSLKYSERNPIIDITSETLTPEELKNLLKLDKEQSYCKIVFKDNGIGFESQYNEQIFAIFQRLHGKQTYSGTGIGLALCKKIVENHHGLIYAEAEPGAGATFTIILPLKNRKGF
ncbi:MAG: ATP-binding protein [Saprospiraceae bacterium]